MALLSGGYAFYTIFRNTLFGGIPLSIVFGLIWSGIIFNLDRSIVLNIRKGKDNDWKITFGMTLLRLLLAIALGLIVAKPLELKIFEREITNAINNERLDKIEKKKEEISKKGNSKIQEVRKQIRSIDSDIVKLKGELSDRQNRLTAGLVARGEDAGTQSRERQAQEFDQQIKNKENLRDNILEKNLLAFIKEAEDKALEEISSNYRDSDGLPLQLATLESLGNDRSSKISPYFNQINWAITCLFVLIEVLPVLVKILSKDGLYDMIVAEEEEEVSKKLDETKARINQEYENDKNAREKVETFLSNQFSNLLTEVVKSSEYTKVVDELIIGTAIETGEKLKRYSTFIGANPDFYSKHSAKMNFDGLFSGAVSKVAEKLRNLKNTSRSTHEAEIPLVQEPPTQDSVQETEVSQTAHQKAVSQPTVQSEPEDEWEAEEFREGDISATEIEELSGIGIFAKILYSEAEKYRAQGDIQNAKSRLERALLYARENLGENHPYTLKIYEELEDLRQ